MSRRACLAVVLAASMSAACALAQFTEGQSVEVREGDVWSQATVVGREGRRFHIRYQGTTDEEWVTADRLRNVSGGGAAAPGKPAPAPAPAGSGGAQGVGAYSPGQDVEAKRGAAWRPAKYQNTQNGWILVRYTQGNFMEWVEPWRIRATGSKEDLIGNAPMNREAKEGDAPPSAPPGEAPTPIGGVAGWREAVPGDQVLYLDGWKAQPVKLLSIRGDEAQIDDGRMTRRVDAKDVRLAGFRLDAKVGDRVQIREPGGWKAGTVMAREAERVRVMIDGWEHEMHHKWKSLDELRPPGAIDVPPVQTAAAEDLRKVAGYKEADVSSARPLNLLVSSSVQYAPDALSGAASVPALQLSPITGARDGYAPKVIVAARPGKYAIVSSHANGQESAVIDRVNMETGAHVNQVRLAVPADMVVRDVAPSGTRVLMGAPQGDRLEIWSIDGPTPHRQLLLYPYSGNHFEKQARFAAMVADNRLLTIGGKGEMHLWDTATGSAIYTCSASADSRPAISPNGKYVAFSTGADALIIEAESGRAVMDLPLQLGRAKSLAFSADGKELVACDDTSVYGVDLTTGTLAYDLSLPGKTVLNTVALTGPGFAIVNNSILIDLRTKAPVWKYKLGATTTATSSAGQLLFVYAGGRATMLVSATVPHASALRQLQGLPQRNMLLEPGTKVSLIVNVPGAEGERESITRYLQNQLTSNGFVIADNQAVQLIATLERGQAISQEYSNGPRFGPFAQPSERVTISPWISRLRLDCNGRTVWEVSAATGGPSPILMKRGSETAQQAAEQQNRPSTGIFTSTRIPAYMVMPENPLHRFESDFTGRMFRDMPATPDPEQAPNTPGPTPVRMDGNTA